MLEWMKGCHLWEWSALLHPNNSLKRDAPRLRESHVGDWSSPWMREIDSISGRQCAFLIGGEEVLMLQGSRHSCSVSTWAAGRLAASLFFPPEASSQLSDASVCLPLWLGVWDPPSLTRCEALQWESGVWTPGPQRSPATCFLVVLYNSRF